MNTKGLFGKYSDDLSSNTFLAVERWKGKTYMSTVYYVCMDKISGQNGISNCHNIIP
jgi:hypothetical protein